MLTPNNFGLAGSHEKNLGGIRNLTYDLNVSSLGCQSRPCTEFISKGQTFN